MQVNLFTAAALAASALFGQSYLTLVSTTAPGDPARNPDFGTVPVAD